MHISNRLKKIRKLRKIERNDLAKGIVSYSHLSNIETGRFEPSSDILIALAQKLNVPSDYLVRTSEKDMSLEKLLLELKSSIDNLDLERAVEIISDIHSRVPYINSIYQETFFELLEGYYLYKKENYDNSFRIFEKNVLPHIVDSNIDTLPTEFKEVYYYLLAVKYYFSGDYDSSYLYFERQLLLVNSNFLKAIINYNLALVFMRLNKMNDAVIFAQNALDLHLHERQWYKAAETDNLLGIIYWEKYDLINAEKHLINALEMTNQYNFDVLKPNIFHNLGLVYKEENKINKSLEYFFRSLKLKKEAQSNNIQATYRAILNILLVQNLLGKAKGFLEEAKQFSTVEEDKFQLKIVEARINYRLNEYDRFEAFMKESVNYFQLIGRWKVVLEIAEDLGDYYVSLRKYKLATKYFKIALIANKKLNGGRFSEKD